MNDLVLLLPDKLSFGPLFEDDQSISLLSGRREYWAEHFSDLGLSYLNHDCLLSCQSEISNAEEVVFYVGYGIDEKLFYIVAHQIFRKLNVSIRRFNFVDLSVNPEDGLLVTNPARISTIDSLNAFIKEMRALDQLERDCLSKIYALILNDDPSALNDFNQQCQSIGCSSFVKMLMQRYPERVHGLNLLEYKLLESCSTSGPKLSYILADMISNNEDPDQCPDLILKDLIIWFASNNYREPLLKLNGDSTGFKLDVFLTEFGKAVLAGVENHVNVNGIDSWIGGVHLKSEYGSPWYYDQASEKLLKS